MRIVGRLTAQVRRRLADSRVPDSESGGDLLLRQAAGNLREIERHGARRVARVATIDRRTIDAQAVGDCFNYAVERWSEPELPPSRDLAFSLITNAAGRA